MTLILKLILSIGIGTFTAFTYAWITAEAPPKFIFIGVSLFIFVILPRRM